MNGDSVYKEEQKSSQSCILCSPVHSEFPPLSLIQDKTAKSEELIFF